jgi:hypothetical protein
MKQRLLLDGIYITGNYALVNETDQRAGFVLPHPADAPFAVCDDAAMGTEPTVNTSFSNPVV